MKIIDEIEIVLYFNYIWTVSVFCWIYYVKNIFFIKAPYIILFRDKKWMKKQIKFEYW